MSGFIIKYKTSLLSYVQIGSNAMKTNILLMHTIQCCLYKSSLLDWWISSIIFILLLS